MKKTVLLSAGFAIALAFTKCSKDIAPDPNLVAANCATATITYNKTIKKIMDDNCSTSGCHDGTTKQSGYDFSTYLGTKAGISRGLQNITGNGVIMPPRPASKLADSLITQIQQWANNGTCE